MEYNEEYTGPTLLKQLTEYAEELARTPYCPPVPPPDPETQETDHMLEDALLDPGGEVSEPPVCLQINDNGTAANVCTLGNFSLAIGKAKSRKSFFASLTFSIVTGYDNGRFTGTLPPGRNVGMYFDTEQGKYHVQMLLDRICKLTGKTTKEQVKVYSLRKYTPLERLRMIERAIYANDNVGFVVIDGIRDLVTSINDEEQATFIAAKLLRWTEERGIHIMTVLHQNKSDNHARGHLGSELTNKAETVLSVTKNEADKNVSIVEVSYCRDKDFSPFAFTVNEDGIPEVMEEWTGNRQAVREKISVVGGLGDRNICNVLTKCFSHTASLKYTELSLQMKSALTGLYGKNVSDNKVKEVFTYSRAKNWLVQEKEYGPYTLGDMSGVEWGR